MGDGASVTEEDWPEPSVVTVKLVDAPILFFVATHKAFRLELESLRRLAAEAAEGGAAGRALVVDLQQRLDFLKLVYNYHSAAEDEVIFFALDALVKNVVSTYALEHQSIAENFSSIFLHLDLLMKEDEEAPQMFQELLFSIGTVQSMICQHLQKEEEQVFPLVMKKFTSEEQCQLVWQYLCSVPFMLLEDFLPWLALYLTSDEKLDLIDCIGLIIQKEKLLQEVVISWIPCEERSSNTDNVYGKGYQLLTGLSSSMDIHMVYALQIHCEQDQQIEKEVYVNAIYTWHAALRRDLDQVIQELYQIRNSNCFSSLSSALIQIKFIADVLICYSNCLDKIFCPLLNPIAKDSLSLRGPLIDEFQIKNLRRLLFWESKSSSQLRDYVESLFEELKSLLGNVSRYLMFLETEVFPSISRSCTNEMQLWLLYSCLHIMPLGLLRFTVTWFSGQLTKSQSQSVLKNMKLGCPPINKSFTSLLHEWVRMGSSGKISDEKFRQDLIEMLNGRSFFLAQQSRQNAASSEQLPEPNSAAKMKDPSAIPSSSSFNEENDIYNQNGMNLDVFSSVPSVHKLAETGHSTFQVLELRPMDIIFYMHRALMKDMKYLISLSAKLTADVGLLAEFKNRFNFLHLIYQIHSNSEDEIAFPALESKRALQNISQSYCIDHKLESKHFRKTSIILNEISELHEQDRSNKSRLKHGQLCLKLHDSCLSMYKVLSDHMYREEVEIFPLFRGCFSAEEEEKIVGYMLGRTGAENLQKLIPWLMAYLLPDEQHAVMSIWLKVAGYTKFQEWLQEWWEGVARYNNSTAEVGPRSSPLLVADPLEVVATYLLKDGSQNKKAGHHIGTKKGFSLDDARHSGSRDGDTPAHAYGDGNQSRALYEFQTEVDEKIVKEVNDKCPNDTQKLEDECKKLDHQVHPLGINQDELEATIRRVSCDPDLDGEKKSYIIQNLLMSQWIIKQKISHKEDQGANMTNHKEEIPGKNASYRDSLKLTFGCKHYKRNCKLFFPCCSKIFTCLRCHDDLTDHYVDRKTVTKMMCMKCLVIQPIGPTCMTETCKGFSMGRYYCQICKLFDDERQIYHCPFCNLCRVGKGLGIEYFHCMKCNACMSRSLFVHTCREKCLEDNCPICHEYIFTSNLPVKSLPCGHLMHSACFRDYTCSHYICPICSKSLGDMQVYFEMLDALLAEEKIPEEYCGQTQAILCNDCEKKGSASFHWLYHKCPFCGSYNTRLL